MRSSRGGSGRGGSYSIEVVQAVWNKATTVFGRDANLWRNDATGALIYRNHYGVIVATGWEIDHVMPVALGGGDETWNLQALHWQNNRAKSDTHPLAASLGFGRGALPPPPRPSSWEAVTRLRALPPPPPPDDLGWLQRQAIAGTPQSDRSAQDGGEALLRALAGVRGAR